MGGLLSIGMVANKAGVTPDTIRYYERLGLLPTPTRTPAGYRQYADGVVNRLTLIRNAQQFGFSLRDIASFLRVREQGGRPCHDVRRAAEQMLEAVDRQITELVATRDHMQQTLRLWGKKLAGTSDDRPAYLLETLSPSNRQRHDGRARRTFRSDVAKRRS
jgi:DNA-binding transcriptional MerR regulator